MVQIRRADDRGDFQIDWLKSKHSFSFGQYHDPNFMGFGPLRVINEDRVTGGGGFAPHSHQNMEILSYVISGGLEHKDSKGNTAVIRPGDVQRMTAGSGITHSEYNASQTEGVHFLQIWIMPDTAGLEPGYEQIAFPDQDRRNALKLVASKTGEAGSVTIHQDVKLYASVLEAGETVSLKLQAQRGAWVQVIRGSVTTGGETLDAGDGLAAKDIDTLDIISREEAEFLVFDLPMLH